MELASLRELPEVYDRALTYCPELTSSEMGFINLLSEDQQVCDVVAVKGFQPVDEEFYERFRVLPARRSLFGGIARKVLAGRPEPPREVDYHAADEQLLSTLANHVAVEIDNAACPPANGR